MKQRIITTIKIEPEVYEDFQILNIKRKKHIGDAIGDLVTEEVHKSKNIIEGK